MSIRRFGARESSSTVVDVELMEHYAKELQRLGPVGPILGQAARSIRSAKVAAPDDVYSFWSETKDVFLSEIKDIGPALDFVQRQVVAADLSVRSLHHSYYWVPMRLTMPERCYDPLVQWASVGRTFDNARSLLRRAGDDQMSKRLYEYQEPLSHLQKAIQTVVRYGKQFV